MNRRKALVAIGVIVAGLKGQWVSSDEGKDSDVLSFYTKLTKLVFHEEALETLEIVRKNGKSIEIPMSEILDALEKPSR